VNAPPDPKRWTAPGADVPVDLVGLLHAAQAELGTTNEVSELARRLSSVLGPAAGLASPHVSSDDARDPHVPSGARAVGRFGARSVGRLAAWTAAGVSALAGAWFAASSFSVPDGPAPPVAPAAPASAPETPGGLAPQSPHTPPPPSADPLGPATTGSAERSDTPAADRTGAADPPREDRRRPNHRAARRAPAAPRASQTLAEAALLDRARAAIETDAARALTLTKDHQQRFPRGALAEEREAIATLALKRLGRHEEARQRAAAFERRYRGSVHRPRLDSSKDGASKPSSETNPAKDTSSPAEGDLDTARRGR
jgi:hypothetical protein